MGILVVVLSVLLILGIFGLISSVLSKDFLSNADAQCSFGVCAG